jgi:hypothetical protein
MSCQLGFDVSMLWPPLRQMLTCYPWGEADAGKDENGRKWSKTILQYRKTKAVGSGYFYILAIKEYKKK